jgi:hypothetical protein
MRRLSLKAGARLAALAAISTSLLTLGGGIQSIPAHADPLDHSTGVLVGVGSDTIQDLFDAYAGQAGSPATGYSALTTGTGNVPLVSWDAVQPGTGVSHDCIVSPKPGFSQIIRPNGSAQGQAALSRSDDGGMWTVSGVTGCAATGTGNVTGSIDYARSSAGPDTSNPGTQLTFFAFGRDGVSYAIFDHGNGDIGALTSAQLQALYGTNNVATGGTITVVTGGVTHTVHACMVQSGSGTGKFWDKAMGNGPTNLGTTSLTSAQNSGCNAGTNGPYEENGYNSWSTHMATLFPNATDEAVIPFSAGQWVAQANGVSVDRSSAGRPSTAPVNEIGSIDGVSPIVVGPPEAPNTTYFNNTTSPPGCPNMLIAPCIYGRDLYVVVPTSKTTGLATTPLKTMFTNLKGAATICSAAAQATAVKFGFLPSVVTTCGNSDGTQNYVANP